MVNDSQATGITYVETKVLENITAEHEETERYYKSVVRQKNNIITRLEKEARDHKNTIRQLIKELDRANQ